MHGLSNIENTFYDDNMNIIFINNSSYYVCIKSDGTNEVAFEDVCGGVSVATFQCLQQAIDFAKLQASSKLCWKTSFEDGIFVTKPFGDFGRGYKIQHVRSDASFIVRCNNTFIAKFFNLDQAKELIESLN